MSLEIDDLEQRAFAIRQLQETTGWKIILDEAIKTKDSMLKNMLYCRPDSQEMYDYQAQARAMTFLLGFPEHVLGELERVQTIEVDGEPQSLSDQPH